MFNLKHIFKRKLPNGLDEMINEELGDHEDAIKLPNHASVRKVDPYGFHVYHIRQAWLFRMSMMMNIVLLLIVIFITSSFMAVLPLKEIRVALLQTDPAENKIFRILPIKQDVDGFELILELKAKEFVQKILTINILTQHEWVKDAFILASPPFQAKFKKERIDTNAIQKLLDRGVRRQIDLVSVDHLESLQPNIYKLVVDFIQSDFDDDRLLEKRHLRAYLSMTTASESVLEAQKYQNPLGVRILNMSVQSRNADLNPLEESQ